MRKVILLVAFLASCSSAPVVCPGFEAVSTGSGCREIATGKFVQAQKCACQAK